jgi:hypothetical protein
VRFPTGGIARKPKGMIRFDSGADSIVWMGEDGISLLTSEDFRGFFVSSKCPDKFRRYHDE